MITRTSPVGIVARPVGVVLETGQGSLGQAGSRCLFGMAMLIQSWGLWISYQCHGEENVVQTASLGVVMNMILMQRSKVVLLG